MLFMLMDLNIFLPLSLSHTNTHTHKTKLTSNYFFKVFLNTIYASKFIADIIVRKASFKHFALHLPGFGTTHFWGSHLAHWFYLLYLFNVWIFRESSPKCQSKIQQSSLNVHQYHCFVLNTKTIKPTILLFSCQTVHSYCCLFFYS